MKYIITEEQFKELINQDNPDKGESVKKTMYKVFRILFKNIKLPLDIQDIGYRHIYYNSPDNKVLFIKNSDDNDLTKTKWVVDVSLETVEKMFGKEDFEKFILDYFGFDLTDKGKKINDWVFVNLNHA